MTTGLLLVHAFPLDARMWEPQLATFADALPVVAPHLPGFGGSTPAGEVLTMDLAAARCLEALDEAGVDRAVVVGLSMGGYATLALHAMAPDRVAGLVLANTRAGGDTPEAADARRALAARLGEEGSGFLVAAPPPLLAEDAPAALQDRVRGIIADQPAASIAAAALGMAVRPDRTDSLGSIAVPTLVLTSDGDRMIPPALSTPMAEKIPAADLVVIPGAGHLSNLEAPGAFDEALAAHLSRCGLA